MPGGPVPAKPWGKPRKERLRMKRSASAVWRGGIRDGSGTVSSESGVLSNAPYNFKQRFESEKGTNPEELVAAAHAARFSMALSSSMSKEGLNPESIDTTATVTFENVNRSEERRVGKEGKK